MWPRISSTRVTVVIQVRVYRQSKPTVLSLNRADTKGTCEDGMSVRGATRTQPMKSAKNTRPPRRSWQLGVALLFAFFGLVVVSAIGLVGYQILYSDRIHRGVQVWNLQLGGLTRSEAESSAIT